MAQRAAPLRDAGRRLAGLASLAALVLLVGVAPSFASGCGVAQPAGRTDAALASGGKERQFATYVPSTYDPSKPVPLVLDFHGSESTANEQLDRSAWERVAEREGFVVVAPQGSIATKRPGTFAWNVPGVAKGDADEATFIKDVITAVEARLCIDRSRIYATGYSGGGRMVSQFLCDGHDEFAAAGLVVGLRAGVPRKEGEAFVPDPGTCKPARPMSLIAFAGLEDKINPIAGQGQPYWGYGADAALQRWVELDGCKSPPQVTQSGTVEKTVYAACNGGASIVSYRFAKAGHTWPGSTALLKVQQPVGRVSLEVDATETMWEFFSQVSQASR